MPPPWLLPSQTYILLSKCTPNCQCSYLISYHKGEILIFFTKEQCYREMLFFLLHFVVRRKCPFQVSSNFKSGVSSVHSINLLSQQALYAPTEINTLQIK
jgi:hypothetical protein